MSYAVGSLVQVRGREWVVLPESKDDLLVLRPLGGLDEEVTGILPSLEEIRPAHFDLPNPEDVGDYRSCRILRDAVRLSTRASAGPFRSFGRIAFSPRPYQLVPLLMALKLDPVRMLIADDVGVGKTIEALMVARELLDRGEIQRTAILCPPHLAEQWQGELASKFQIEAELVLSSTARQLERRCRVGQSLFDLYPHVVVSMDFVKSDRRRDEFVNKCPEMVIVDEAHTCAYGYEGRGGRHQRHQMVKSLCANPSRHMIFVTATPHSGKEEPFRALLGFLDPGYAHSPFRLDRTRQRNPIEENWRVILSNEEGRTFATSCRQRPLSRNAWNGRTPTNSPRITVSSSKRYLSTPRKSSGRPREANFNKGCVGGVRSHYYVP